MRTGAHGPFLVECTTIYRYVPDLSALDTQIPCGDGAERERGTGSSGGERGGEWWADGDGPLLQEGRRGEEGEA